MALKWGAGETLHDLTQVRGQFVAQPVVNVQLRLTALGKVHRVNRMRLLDECLVVLLHRLLTRSIGLSRCWVTAFWWWPLESGTARARSDVELALEILHLEPECQVLFAKVIPEKFAKQVTESGIVDDEL